MGRGFINLPNPSLTATNGSANNDTRQMFVGFSGECFGIGSSAEVGIERKT